MPLRRGIGGVLLAGTWGGLAVVDAHKFASAGAAVSCVDRTQARGETTIVGHGIRFDR